MATIRLSDLRSSTGRMDWFSKALFKPTEECAIAASLKNAGEIDDILESGLSPDSYRTRLCWSCIHETVSGATSEEYVCEKHREFIEDRFAANVRLENIKRYRELHE
ncbi:MAG: hypothetical protein RTU30_14960 [Candidatus Thorarchaeota archaeon]